VKQTLELRPVTVWIWVAFLALLLLLPLAVSWRQAAARFDEDLRQGKRSRQKSVQWVLGRYAEERAPEVALDWLLGSLFQDSDRLFRDARYRERLVKGLRSAVPGVSLVWLDPSLEPLWDRSDAVSGKTPVRAFAGMLALRERSTLDSEADKALEKTLYLKTRWFGNEAAMGPAFRFAKTPHALDLGPGRRGWVCWLTADGDKRRWGLGGVIVLVDESRLPRCFAASTFLKRHHRAMKARGLHFGWIDLQAGRDSRFPRGVRGARRAEFVRATVGRPVTSFEYPPLRALGGVFHDGRIVTWALASVRPLERQHETASRRMALLFLLVAAMPFVVVLAWRANEGLALGLRFQVLGLFLFAIGTPTLATLQLGNDLLHDHRIAAEREVYQSMETLAEMVDTGFQLGLKQFEQNCREFARKIGAAWLTGVEMDETTRERWAAELRPTFQKTGATHFLLFDERSEVRFRISQSVMREQETKEFMPIYRSIARLKLQAANRDASGGRSDLIDQFLQQSFENMQELKTRFLRESRPTMLQAVGKTVYAHAILDEVPVPPGGGEGSEGRAGGVQVQLYLANDRDFEEGFLDWFITRVLARAEEVGEGVTVLGVDHGAAVEEAFRPADPAVNGFNRPTAAPLRKVLISTALPTLKSGFTVRDTVDLGGRKHLFLSQRDRHLNQFSLVFLYDLARIDARLAALSRQTFAYVCLSLIISVALAVTLARGLLLPIARLRDGVDHVARGEFDVTIRMPGRDELVALGEAFNGMTRGLAERERMTSFLSRSTLASVQQETAARIGGDLVFAGVLYASIRGFTTMAETRPPQQVVALLNEYFAGMTDVIAAAGGDLDKFMGDALMGVFRPSGPDAPPEVLAGRTVACALAMVTALEAFNLRRRTGPARDPFPVQIGIGIAHGQLISGSIGSSRRREYTVVGDAVGLAAGLEKKSSRGKHTCILVCGTTARLTAGAFEYERLPEDTLEGRTRSVEMYELVRARGRG